MLKYALVPAPGLSLYFRVIVPSRSSKSNSLRFYPFLCLLLIGCTATKNLSHEPAEEDPMQQYSEEEKKDIAVRYYIAGSVSESKNDLDAALTSYYHALRFDENAALYAAAARCYAGMGRWDMVSHFSRKAVWLDSTNTTYREELAHALMMTMHYDSALTEFEHLIRLSPENVEARFTLARLYQSSEPEKALELYRGLLDDIGAEGDLLFALAETYSMLGRFDESAEALEHLRRLDPDDEGVLLNLSDIYHQAGKYTQAISVQHELLTRFPENLHHRVSLAQLLLSADRWYEADSVLMRVLETDSLDIEIAMEAGEIYLQHSLIDSSVTPKASNVFEALMKDFEEDWRPYWLAGAMHFNHGRYEESISHFQKALRRDPNNGQTLDILARAYLAIEDYSSAIKPLQTIIDWKLATAETYTYLGLAFVKLGKHERSVEALRKALELDSNRMDALSTLAMTLDDMNRYDESDSLYERALLAYDRNEVRKDATYYLLLNNFAYALSERGIELERALEMSGKAVSFEERNSSYLDTIGWIYHKMGMHDLALKYIQAAIDAREAAGEPVGSVLYEHLGDVYQALGDKQQALKYWKSGAEQDPSNKNITEKIFRNTQ